MLVCPNCRIRLRSNQFEGNFHWVCALCQGRAVRRDTLQKLDNTGRVESLWEKVSKSPNRMGKPCAECARPMSSILAAADVEPVELDFCTRCALLWLDHGEQERMAKRVRPDESDPRLTAVHVVLCMIGLPVEHHQRKFSGKPWLTWLLITVVILASIWGFLNPREAMDGFAFFPGNPLRNGGITLFTDFFLHGGVMHLVSNMYFLHLFGDDAEDVLGKFRYAMLLLLSAFMGNVLRMVLDPHSEIPTVGASGGIFGVVVYYLLSFPRARVGLGGWYTLFRPIYIRAWWVLLFFMGMQIIGAIGQVSGYSSTSYLDHLGGGFIGLLFWIWFKPS